MYVDRWWPRTLAMVAILSVHTAIITDFFGPHSRDAAHAAEVGVFATAEILVRDESLEKVPAPELQLESIPVGLAAPREIDFDDSIQDELAQITGPASAPHLARVQSVDPATFARRAQLLAGQALTVLLRLEVREDGSVGSADVVRPSGNALVDAAATAYALELRWVPGTDDRVPKTMRVTFSVTLASPAGKL